MHRGSSKWLVVAAVVAALAVPGMAHAQAGWKNGYFTLGGGVRNFRSGSLRGAFDLGGTWDARLGIGNGTFLGLEADYVGSYQNGKSGRPNMLTNGAEGVLRLQAPIGVQAFLLEPYVFGGVGWSYVSLMHAPSGIASNENIGTIPFGAGITLGSEGFLLDARFTWRKTFNDSIQLGTDGAKNLENYDVTANVGFAF